MGSAWVCFSGADIVTVFTVPAGTSYFSRASQEVRSCGTFADSPLVESSPDYFSACKVSICLTKLC